MYSDNVLKYDDAIAYTIPRTPHSLIHRMFGTNILQMIAFLGISFGLYSTNVVMTGLAFLQKEPNEFECYYDISHQQMFRQQQQHHTSIQTQQEFFRTMSIEWDHSPSHISHSINDASKMTKTEKDTQVTKFWNKCTKEDICTRKPYGKYFLRPSKIRPNQEDPEYLDNWVEKLGMLCERSDRIGMLGSAFFIGIIIGMFIVPQMADIWGRKYIFVLTMITSLIGQVGLMSSQSLNLTAIYMIVIGASFPGKNIVGLNYLLELYPEKKHTKIVTYQQAFDCVTLLGIAVGYEYISRNWLWLQFIGIGGTSFALLVSAFLLPESPKILYIQNRYDESRKALFYIARFNQSNFPGTPFCFDRERVQIDQKLNADNNKDDEHQPLLQQKGQQESNYITPRMNNEIKLSESQYQWNIIKMTIMWSTTVFATYLIMFQLKYLKGNIFQNTKSYAISDLTSRLCGGLFFTHFGMKKSFIMAYIIALVGGVMIYVIQSESIKLEDHYFLGHKITPYQLMPGFTMITKFGMGVAMLSCYSACYSDDNIFPADKRATAIGICNIVARSLTIFASQVNELKPPLPMLTFNFVVGIALISSFSFITEREVQKKHYDEIVNQTRTQIPKQTPSQSKDKPDRSGGEDLSTASNDPAIIITPVDDALNCDQKNPQYLNLQEQNNQCQKKMILTPDGAYAFEETSSCYSKSETLYSLPECEYSRGSIKRGLADCHISRISHRRSLDDQTTHSILNQESSNFIYNDYCNEMDDGVNRLQKQESNLGGQKLEYDEFYYVQN